MSTRRKAGEDAARLAKKAKLADNESSPSIATKETTMSHATGPAKEPQEEGQSSENDATTRPSSQNVDHVPTPAQDNSVPSSSNKDDAVDAHNGSSDSTDNSTDVVTTPAPIPDNTGASAEVVVSPDADKSSGTNAITGAVRLVDNPTVPAGVAASPSAPILKHTRPVRPNHVIMKGGVTRAMIVRVIIAVTATDLVLSDVERDFVPEELLDRVVRILNFQDINTNRFAVGMIPLHVTWGTEAQGPDMDRYVVNGGTRLTVWFIGLVTTVWLTPREGSRINIGLKMLCKRDHDAARHLQYDISSPAMDPSTAGQTVFCSRFLNTRAEEGGTFDEVYDARARLLPWGQMTQIDASRIQKTDVVLVECYIKRFKSKERNARKGWNAWAVNFDLIRIAQLSAGPGAAADLVPDDCDVDL